MTKYRTEPTDFYLTELQMHFEMFYYSYLTLYMHDVNMSFY